MQDTIPKMRSISPEMFNMLKEFHRDIRDGRRNNLVKNGNTLQIIPEDELMESDNVIVSYGDALGKRVYFSMEYGQGEQLYNSFIGYIRRKLDEAEGAYV